MITKKISPLTDIKFSTILEVRINNINYGNHLGHDSLISLLHEARVKFLRGMGFTELDLDGLALIMTHLAVNYIKEAFYGDSLTINIGIEEVSKISVQLNYQVKNTVSNIEIARALTTMTFYDYHNKKIARVPKLFLEKVSV